jgi:FixJ family two-component response regulator
VGAGFVVQNEKTQMIAIVHDDKALRDALEMLMRSLGHKAIKFGSAEEFLKFEQLHDTSCLITDVQMPGLTGIDLQDRLIADGHRIPIIFLTGYPNDNARARAMRAGPVAFLRKPVNADHLIGCVEKALQAA